MTLTRTSYAEARLRPKNQMTLPEAVARALHARPGDTIVFQLDRDGPPDAPPMIAVQLLLPTYAGALTGVFGTTEELKAHLREEHDDWDEQSRG